VSVSTGPILVVEDIGPVRELLEAQLRLRGYRVVTARDGQEALERIAAERPAVIVTDILMPRLDGFALAYQLRSQPQTRAIPIIFLSATYVSADDEGFALRLGVLRFMPKPVDADALFLAVSDALTGQAPAAEPVAEQEFYAGYRDRLESKLRQKSAQAARAQQQLAALPEGQRDTYERLLGETREQQAELQRELDVLNRALSQMS